MRLDAEACRARMSAARVARLATAGRDARPHLVPVVFALDGDRLVTAVDQKPKSTTRLRRLRNIAENPQVSVLADDYTEDWSQLWWVRADGMATVVDDPAARRFALDLLAAKYEPYGVDPPRGPVIEVRIDTWSGWSAHGA